MPTAWWRFISNPMKIFFTLAGVLLAVQAFGQPQPREATAAEVSAGTIGSPAYLTPRRAAAIPFVATNLPLSTATNIANGSAATVSNSITTGLTNQNLYYVTPTGKDSNLGNSQLSAWNTVSNGITKLPVGGNLSILPGGYFNIYTNGSSYLPKSSIISGYSAESVTVSNGGAGSATLQNTTLFAVSDNSTLEHMTICIGTNQANNNGWIATVVGHQRSHQNDGYPHYAETATNFLIRDISSSFPADHQCLVFDSTNTFQGMVRDCNLVANQVVEQIGNCMADGTLGHQDGAPIPGGTNYCINPADGITNKNNTFTITSLGGVGFPTAGTAPVICSVGTNNYFSSDTRCVFYSTAAQPISGFVASGMILCGTNTSATWSSSDCSFIGPASAWTNGNGCTLGQIVITGVSNTLILNVPVNVVDAGTSDTIITNYPASNPGIPTLFTNASTLISAAQIAGNDRAFNVGLLTSASAQVGNSNYLTITLPKPSSINPVIATFSQTSWGGGTWTNSQTGNKAGTIAFQLVTTSNTVVFQTVGTVDIPGSSAFYAFSVNVNPQ